MRVLHLSSSDRSGGGCISAYRLHHALLSEGVDSAMLVGKDVTGEKEVFRPALRKVRGSGYVLSKLDRWQLKRQVGFKPAQFSLSSFGYGLRSAVEKLEPDIINLHWINGGFTSVKELGSLAGIPAVWTFHDQWAFTGGCHYSYECDRFQESCGACPQLRSDLEDDASRRLWEKKHRLWRGFDPVVVAPSRWLCELAQQSSLFRAQPVRHIPYGLEQDVFEPGQRAAGRKFLGIGEATPIVLFGALAAQNDARKGFDLLTDALCSSSARLAELGVEFVIFGNLGDATLPPELESFKIHQLGHISEPAKLARIYAAADAFVAPSRADNLPNTVLEASACGTPTIAFDVGGMPDMIEDGVTGYLAEPFNAVDLGEKIVRLFEGGLGDDARGATRRKTELEFDYATQAKRYTSLYSTILETAGTELDSKMAVE